MLQESERDELVMGLVDAALEQPCESRPIYLSKACGGDDLLRAEVQERVDWEERMGGFLREPAVAGFDLLEDSFLPGEEVAGRFQITCEAGRGGMGVVYEAFDQKLKRRVAIKVAHPGYGQRLPPEARAAREVSHFNVCKVYDLHTAGTPLGEVEFLSMEFIDGKSLNARIRQDGPFSPAEAMNVALQVCAGLAQAHRQGVIHGDLKGGNIILSQWSGGTRAVLTDFGLATLKLPGAEVQGLQGGSLDYMAPELYCGASPSVASDLYALGVLFHFMLTGKTPGRAEALRGVELHATTVSMTAGAAKLTGARRVETLPSPWDAVVARCLEASPEDRFGSADEVIDQLQARSTRRKWIAASAAAAATLGLAAWLNSGGSGAAGRGSIRSIAVIPFVNSRNTPEYQYLCEGISEGLINALAQLLDLKVIARSSSFKFRGDAIDVRKVARTLGVRALVTGRVAEMDGRLRISAELVNGEDGTQIWGSHYSPRLADLAAVQAGISGEIAERIRSELTSAERARLAREAKVHPEAYGLLLRGRYELRLYTPESRQKAVSHYEQALAIDPAFALAHAELAAAYRLLSASGISSAAEVLPKAEAAARRALAADQNLAEAHFALAGIQRDQWNWAAAEREYRRAIELSPNLAAAHQGFATCLSVTGRYEAALKEVQRARDLDPISLPTAIAGAAVSYNARRYGQALEALRKAMDLDPSAPTPWSWTGMAHGAGGQFTQAALAYEKAFSLGDRTGATQCYYAYALARSGRRRQALQILGRLEQSRTFVPASTLAIAYAGLNDTDRAIQLLESSYGSRDPLLQYMNVEAHFDNIRDDRRFRGLAAKIGLP